MCGERRNKRLDSVTLMVEDLSSQNVQGKAVWALELSASWDRETQEELKLTVERLSCLREVTQGPRLRLTRVLAKIAQIMCNFRLSQDQRPKKQP